MEPVTLHRSIDLDLDPAEAWRFVGNAAGLEEWLADDVELELVDGATGTMVDDGVVREVVVTRVDHGRELAFEWWHDGEADHRSSVVITVTPGTDGDSRIEVVETFLVASGGAGVVPASLSARTMRWETAALQLSNCSQRVLVG